MFVLQRSTSLGLLISTIGILITQLYIQPAQGLVCLSCTECETGETTNAVCGRKEDFCGESEVETPAGTRGQFSRGCITSGFAANSGYSCDKFKPYTTPNLAPGHKLRFCVCETDLCNLNVKPTEPGGTGGGKSTEKGSVGSNSIRIQVLLRLLLLSILVSVSASWINC